MDIFAPYSHNLLCFVIMNIAPSKKTISVFNEPTGWLKQRDLLKTPGISEASLRSALLKGQLNHKIRAGEITVLCSDIDLTQYNLANTSFLQAAGITNGLGPGGSGSGITANQHQTLPQLIHYLETGGPGAGFFPQLLKTITPPGPFPTRTVWSDITGNIPIVQKDIQYNLNKSISQILWTMFMPDGITISQQIVDVYSYVNNIYESAITRTVIVS